MSHRLPYLTGLQTGHPLEVRFHVSFQFFHPKAPGPSYAKPGPFIWRSQYYLLFCGPSWALASLSWAFTTKGRQHSFPCSACFDKVHHVTPHETSMSDKLEIDHNIYVHGSGWYNTKDQTNVFGICSSSIHHSVASMLDAARPETCRRGYGKCE